MWLEANAVKVRRLRTLVSAYISNYMENWPVRMKISLQSSFGASSGIASLKVRSEHYGMLQQKQLTLLQLFKPHVSFVLSWIIAC